MTTPLEFNARSVPPTEVAKSFIPPEQHFADLLSRNHTLVLGPRGSGKTTLFKMLTLRALKGWSHPKAESYSSLIQFNAAFVPADIAWGGQISAFEMLDLGPERKESAFVIHTLRSLIRAIRDAVEISRKGFPSHLSHLVVNINQSDEEKLAGYISQQLGLSLPMQSLLGVEVALDTLLDKLSVEPTNRQFSVESLPSKISATITIFNSVAGCEERCWALLFDEMEIAPSRIKNFLLSGIRSFDGRVIIKLALAPYLDDARFEKTPVSPHALHDYQTLQLSYPNKELSTRFASELFVGTFARLGYEVDNLNAIFAEPIEGGFGRRSNSGKKKSIIPVEFRELADKDDSFMSYVQERGIFSSKYQLIEKNLARDIRKVLPIVVARNYYLRKFENGRAVASRSRKAYTLYAGYPSVIEITEGNPRAILTMVSLLVQDLYEQEGQEKSYKKISLSRQSQAIKRAELLLTSLLQVIPIDLSGLDKGKGLLDFIDGIGRRLEDRLLRQNFRTDYVGTFIIDNDVSEDVVSAVGLALNTGAIIHVPHAGGGPDDLLRGLRGQRFRISYALSARYRLLLTLGDQVHLSKLVLEVQNAIISSSQGALFDADDEADEDE